VSNVNKIINFYGSQLEELNGWVELFLIDRADGTKTRNRNCLSTVCSNKKQLIASIERLSKLTNDSIRLYISDTIHLKENRDKLCQQIAKEMIESCINGSSKSPWAITTSSLRSVCSTFYVIDYDDNDEAKLNHIINLCNWKPHLKIKTPNGFHLLMPRFDRRELISMYDCGFNYLETDTKPLLYVCGGY